MSLKDFFLPRWKHSDWTIRLEAVSTLTSEDALAEIARTDSDQDVRKEAVGRLTNEAVLAEVATADTDEDVSLEAVGRVTDQDLLIEVVRAADRWEARTAAMSKLTSQEVLVEIARTNSYPGVRWRAVERLIDQTVLADIAKFDDDENVRETAVRRLTDQAVLADIARTDGNEDVRKAAVRRLTDQAVLADIARTDEDLTARKAAIRRLTEPDVLADIALNAMTQGERVTAVKALRGEASAVLVTVALEDANKTIRKVAASRLRARAYSVLFRLAGQPLPKWVTKDLRDLSEPIEDIPALAQLDDWGREKLLRGEVPEELVRSLARTGDPGAVLPLIHALGTERGITTALSLLDPGWTRRNDARNSAALLRVLLQYAVQQRIWTDGQAAVQAILAIGDQAGVEDILRAGQGGGCGRRGCSSKLCPSCRSITEMAIESLTKAGDRRVVPLLLYHLSRNRALSYEAAEALGEPTFVEWIVDRASDQGALLPAEPPKFAKIVDSIDSGEALSRLEKRIRTAKRGPLGEEDVRSVLSLRGKTEYREWERGDDDLDLGYGDMPLDLSVVKWALIERLQAAGFDEGSIG